MTRGDGGRGVYAGVDDGVDYSTLDDQRGVSGRFLLQLVNPTSSMRRMPTWETPFPFPSGLKADRAKWRYGSDYSDAIGGNAFADGAA